MDIDKLIEQFEYDAKDWGGDPHIKKDLLDAATALSTLQAENEKLRAELEQVEADRSRYNQIAEAQDRRIDELEAEVKRYVESVKNCRTTGWE